MLFRRYSFIEIANHRFGHSSNQGLIHVPPHSTIHPKFNNACTCRFQWLCYQSSSANSGVSSSSEDRSGSRLGRPRQRSSNRARLLSNGSSRTRLCRIQLTLESMCIVNALSPSPVRLRLDAQLPFKRRRSQALAGLSPIQFRGCLSKSVISFTVQIGRWLAHRSLILMN